MLDHINCHVHVSTSMIGSILINRKKICLLRKYDLKKLEHFSLLTKDHVISAECFPVVYLKLNLEPDTTPQTYQVLTKCQM